jgi:predicted nucleotidyltransferase
MVPLLRERVRAFFDAEPSAVAVYLFGSTARGDAGPTSDIDVAVLFDAPPVATLMGPALSLAGRLEQLLGTPVDLIVLNRASADLVHRVLRDGDLLVDRNPGKRIRFEVAKRNEYFDLQPIRDAYRRASTHVTA